MPHARPAPAQDDAAQAPAPRPPPCQTQCLPQAGRGGLAQRSQGGAAVHCASPCGRARFACGSRLLPRPSGQRLTPCHAMPLHAAAVCVRVRGLQITEYIEPYAAKQAEKTSLHKPSGASPFLVRTAGGCLPCPGHPGRTAARCMLACMLEGGHCTALSTPPQRCCCGPCLPALTQGRHGQVEPDLAWPGRQWLCECLIGPHGSLASSF